MRNRASVFVLLLVVCFAAATLPVHAQAEPSDAPEVTALLKERRDVLQKRVEILEVLCKLSRAPMTELVEAKEEFLIAELELAETKEKRIEILNTRIENLKYAEKFYEVLKKRDKVSEADILEVKAERLLVQAELKRILSKQ